MVCLRAAVSCVVLFFLLVYFRATFTFDPACGVARHHVKMYKKLPAVTHICASHSRASQFYALITHPHTHAHKCMRAQALDAISAFEGLEYATSPDYGFVTSCPTNLGTAMRASVHIPLPNLTKVCIECLDLQMQPLWNWRTLSCNPTRRYTDTPHSVKPSRTVPQRA